MNPTERRTLVRGVLQGNRCVRPASVFDPISCRIAVELGFEMGMLAGSVASLTVLGAPDLTVLTLTELAAQARRICRAAPLPILVDADHGYGNALNVMRTVEELETAGVSALTIEDTELPRRHGGGPTPGMLSLEEGVGKMRAALAARTDPSLVILGRTSAVRLADVDEAIQRAQAYAQTGVDGIFLVGVASWDQLEAIRAAVELPLVLGTVAPALDQAERLAATGVRIALQGHAPFMASVRVVRETMSALRRGVAPDELPPPPDPEEVRRVTRRDQYEDWTRDYLD